MIYLDYAASSPVLPEAAEAARIYMTEEFANPSSIHRAAEKSREQIDCCRRRIAEMLGCSHSEILFTSGGTESNNLALFGAGAGRIRHIITTAIEHESVLSTARAWEKEGEGRKLTVLMPDRCGFVSAEQAERAILGAKDPSAVLVSVMTANNELGTIQPVTKIGAVCRRYGALFHTDAVQAFGHIPIDVKASGIDFLSGSGHKFGAPKGVGFLYRSKDAALRPLQFGGGQERGFRSGTLNTPGIAGLFAAADYAGKHMEESALRIRALRDRFREEVVSALPDTVENSCSTSENCLPGHLNLSFPGIEAESLLIHLDLQGLAASAGSACASGSLEPSHVLTALPGMDTERANGSLRFSFGEFTTEEECREAARILIKSVRKLRELRFGRY